MTDIIEKRDKATTLRKQRNFQDALLLFETLWEETEDKWDGWNLAYCYNKCAEYDKALKVSKEVYAADNDFDYIKGTYAWSAYMLNINNYSGDNYDELKTYANGIMQLTENRQEDVFRHLTVLKVMDYCETKGMWEALLSWSKIIDPKILNAEPYKFKKNGKNITMPSNREKWYLKTSKAYEKSENWERCFETTCNGLNHFPDEIWLKRRKAISQGNLGELDKAIEELKNISFVKSDWFIFRDIAVLHGQNNNYSNALDYIIDGCILSANLPDPGYRWELYYDAALFLYKSGENKMSEKHLILSYSLRENEGWKTPEVIAALAGELGIELKSIENTGSLIKELKKFWEQHKFSKLPKNKGMIKTMLPNGKAGFITSENGEDYYFKVMSFNGKRSQLKPGLKVEFFVQESFDRVKKEKSNQAVNISLNGR
jgi:cold shock CspA family protein|tara:strand:- start:3378 stop:4664 length:1287 start_codon:yes stop_codon:yes gene_type:complete